MFNTTGSEKAFAAGADIKQMQPILYGCLQRRFYNKKLKGFQDAGNQL